MANGVNAAKRASVPSELIDVNKNHGRLRVMYDKYTCEDGDFVVNMGGKLPAGAKIYDAWLKCTAAGGTTATAALGIEGNDDALITPASITTKTVIKMTDDTDAEHGLELTEASQVIATLVDGDADLTGVVVECAVFYVVD